MKILLTKRLSFPNFIVPSLLFVLLLSAQFGSDVFADEVNSFMQAMDEHVIVVKNNELIFEAVKQEWHSSSSDIKLVEMPKWGEARLNDDFTFSYLPAPDICEQQDHFTYIVRSRDQVDTIKVLVDILCENITIFSGFSPDGDGINDTFTVKGIENYPNNSLSIFDFSGEEIYHRNGYHNDWDGSNSLIPLQPDYTYYYVFNDGEGNYYSGYFKMDL